MSNSLILYVGEQQAGQMLAAAAEARGSYVYQPEDLMQALGMYITYFPEITVIDMAVEYAEEALEHLRSVDAKPLVLLSETRLRSASIYTLPPEIGPEALLDALERFDEPQRVSNGVLRYA